MSTLSGHSSLISDECYPKGRRMKNVEEALADFAKTKMPGATSYGKTVYVDDRYVGDVWIYGIDLTDTPNAMLSYCIFDLGLWRKGVATVGVQCFLDEVCARFGLRTVGAFTYAENAASIRVLEKNGFKQIEEFTEDGVASCYYQWRAI